MFNNKLLITVIFVTDLKQKIRVFYEVVNNVENTCLFLELQSSTFAGYRECNFGAFHHRKVVEGVTAWKFVADGNVVVLENTIEHLLNCIEVVGGAITAEIA